MQMKQCIIFTKMGEAELNKLSQYLIRNPDIEIQINGHSDDSGLKFKIQKMSELRAREVFEYLIKKGVQNKMYFKGYGSSQPIADNATEAGRAKNSHPRKPRPAHLLQLPEIPLLARRVQLSQAKISLHCTRATCSSIETTKIE